MKKFLALIFVVLVTLSSCGPESEVQFAGTYKGTYTFLNDNQTKDGSVVITSDPLNENEILLLV